MIKLPTFNGPFKILETLSYLRRAVARVEGGVAVVGGCRSHREDIDRHLILGLDGVGLGDADDLESCVHALLFN